ncbi:peritrophin-1-like [Augochlora pura]
MRGFGAIFVSILVAVAVVEVTVAAKCPPQNGPDVTLLPNPKDCKTYFLCQSGHPFLMQCPEGLYFNPDLRVCDWTIREEKDNCLINLPTTSPAPPTPPPATTTTTPRPEPTTTRAN